MFSRSPVFFAPLARPQTSFIRDLKPRPLCSLPPSPRFALEKMTDDAVTGPSASSGPPAAHPAAAAGGSGSGAANVDPEVAELVARLGMSPHPEGGFYKVQPAGAAWVSLSAAAAGALQRRIPWLRCACASLPSYRTHRAAPRHATPPRQETFRDAATVGASGRSASTAILYLLPAGESWTSDPGADITR